MSLKTYVSREPESRLLGEGKHRVRLAWYLEAGSFTAVKSGKIVGPKDKKFPWINEMPQLVFMVSGKDGVGTGRINFSGCRRYTELSDAEIKSGRFRDEQGFACEVTEAGLVRAEDPERTEVCQRILDHLMWAVGAEPGTPGDVALDNAVACKREFIVDVVIDPWVDEETGEESAQRRFKGFYRIEDEAGGEEPAKFHDLEA